MDLTRTGERREPRETGEEREGISLVKYEKKPEKKRPRILSVEGDDDRATHSTVGSGECGTD